MNSTHFHLLMNFTAHFEYGCDAIPKNVVKQVLPHTRNAYFYFWHPFSVTMFRGFFSLLHGKQIYCILVVLIVFDVLNNLVL